jgi:hypothetical protein
MSDEQRRSVSAEDLRREAHRVHVRFLLTELDAGLTLLHTAETSRRPDTPERARALAREAYDEVAKRLRDPGALVLSAEERERIVRRHAELGRALGVAQ